MVQRYGILADVLSRGFLKVRIDAAKRRIWASTTEKGGPASHPQLKKPSRELDGLQAGERVSCSAAVSRRFASRISYGLLIRPEVGGSRLAAACGTGTFCSEARASTASEAVQSKGVRGISVSRNLTRWTKQAGQEKSQSMLMYLLAMVVAVVGVTYASVPLYRRFCQATGYGGTVQRRETVEEKIAKYGTEDAAASRELVVHFNADVADSMPWKFTPCQNQVKIKVGQSTLAFYTAENTSSEDITGISTYNVAPMQAGAYFNKIQCFCFEEQRLRPGEKIDMPVLFYVDPEFTSDPKMDSIHSLILSYTFFKVEEEDEDE